MMRKEHRDRRPLAYNKAYQPSQDPFPARAFLALLNNSKPLVGPESFHYPYNFSLSYEFCSDL